MNYGKLAAGLVFVAQAGTAFVLGAQPVIVPSAYFLAIGAVNAMLGAALLVLPSIRPTAVVEMPPRG